VTVARVHIVATTIAVPVFLDSYRENLQQYGHLDDVRIWVVGDRKTPPESAEYAADQRARGLDVEYLDPRAQELWLARFPDLAAILPWNSDNRRNVGFLRALEEGCEVLVSIDDDNYCIPESDFFSGHSETGAVLEREVMSSDNGWFDICSELVMEPAVAVVARGYPYKRKNPQVRSEGQRAVPVAANAGLWLGDPDVDAATRLTASIRAVSSKNRSIALQPGTWSPVNTQNTSVARRAIPAYYYVRMLEQLPGAKLDRYGDIWSGYFLTRCAEHLNESVTLGQPLVSHRRNVHDLLSDLRAEIWGMVVTPVLIDVLRSGALSGDNYSDVMRSLGRLVESRAYDVEQLTQLPGVADYLCRIRQYVDLWVDVCAELA
jgi:hypothetical protein